MRRAPTRAQALVQLGHGEFWTEQVNNSQRDQGGRGGGGFFGTPSPESEALQKAIDGKASKSELKSALENRNFVGLNDILRYEATRTSRQWSAALQALRTLINS